MAVSIASLPGLSALLAWPTEHLTDAATHWTATGERWYGVFAQVQHESMSAPWTGNGADALHMRAHADKQKVSDLVDRLHGAAKVARAGASDLYAARSRVQYAVEDAGAAGFVVGQDLSVTDGSTGGSAEARAMRQAQAQAFAADIRRRAAELLALDQQVAGKITTAVAGIGSLSFNEPTGVGDPVTDEDKRHQVQAVDHSWKKDPAPPGGPTDGPTADDVKKALEGLRDGKNRGVKEVPTEQEIFDLWERLSRGGRQLPVPDNYYDRVELPDGTVIGIRESDDYGPTLDVKYPPGVSGPGKVHLPPPPPLPPPGPQPPIVAQPGLPPVLAHPPVAVQPAEPGHPPTGIPPTTLDHPPLAPWLQNPSPPGYHVSPGPPAPLAPFDIPDAPPIPAPPAPPSPPPTLHMPPLPAPSPEQEPGLLATVGGFVLGGLAILGRLGEGFR